MAAISTPLTGAAPRSNRLGCLWSWMTTLTAAGLPLMAYGLIYQVNNKGLWGLFAVGILIVVTGAFGWAAEPG